MTQSTGRSPGQTGLRRQAGNANPTANLVPPIRNQPRLAGGQNQNLNIPINLQPNVSVKVAGAGINTFVSVIPEVRTENIKVLLKVQYLTKLKGEPTYDWMETGEKELGHKALSVKYSFGGGNSGCLGTVCSNTRFKAKSDHDWIVSLSQGAFPIFPNGATVRQKKKLISDFIKRGRGLTCDGARQRGIV